MSELTRKVQWRPAYDKRSEGYGCHGMELRFILQGPLGAVQFLLYTNWHLKHLQKEWDARDDSRYPHLSCHPMPADLGYHSPMPRYENQSKMEKCDLIPGGCYYDGSTLNAEPVYWKFVAEGEEALWSELEKFYSEVFAPKEAVTQP